MPEDQPDVWSALFGHLDKDDADRAIAGCMNLCYLGVGIVDDEHIMDEGPVEGTHLTSEDEFVEAIMGCDDLEGTLRSLFRIVKLELADEDGAEW